MTIKRGRWAGRIPGLRWGGQQIKREPLATLDFETRTFVGIDPGRNDESAMVVLKDGRIIYSGIVKPLPHQLDAMKLLLEGGRPAPLTSRTGRLNAFAPPNIQNLRPVLSEEQQAYRDAIWAAMRKSLGLETPENRDETDTG